METNNNEIAFECINVIKKLTNHNYASLTMRGNKAIMLALKAAKRINPEKNSIIIPDQGGWLTYKQFPKKIKLITKEIKTDYGLLDLDDLEKHINLNDVSALIYSNPAGYFANQDMKKIYQTCKGRCIVILDVSGGIGYEEMCDGNYADIIVGSFGKWKVINAGKGGFISAGKKEVYDCIEIPEELDLKQKEIEDIKKNIENIENRKEMFDRNCNKIKKDLKEFDIIHPEKTGINVIVKFKNEQEKEKIIDYCEKEGYEYTICPKYIRVNENAVSIEVKRL